MPYEPQIVARRGTILFLVEPLADAKSDRKRIDVLSNFLEQHSPEIVLIAVLRADQIPVIPPACYDEVYPDTAIVEVARRIHDQDPKGIVRPFLKPRAGGSV